MIAIGLANLNTCMAATLAHGCSRSAAMHGRLNGPRRRKHLREHDLPLLLNEGIRWDGCRRVTAMPAGTHPPWRHRQSAADHGGRSSGRLGAGRSECMKPAPESKTPGVGMGAPTRSDSKTSRRRCRFRALRRGGRTTDHRGRAPYRRRRRRLACRRAGHRAI